MTELQRPIAYLEDHDFDNHGRLINTEIPNNIPVVIMIQAGWCNYCDKAKPAFQTFADRERGKIFCATIQIDGERQSEKKLGERIYDIAYDLHEYPYYILYKNGEKIKKTITGRLVEDLQKFSKII